MIGLGSANLGAAFTGGGARDEAETIATIERVIASITKNQVIVRAADNNFTGIVEEKDAADAERRITEVNMSTYVFDSSELIDALEQIKNDNLQGEYYLTDAPGILKAAHKDVRALTVLQPCEALSINNMEDLAVVEAEMEKLGYERAKDL